MKSKKQGKRYQVHSGATLQRVGELVFTGFNAVFKHLIQDNVMTKRVGIVGTLFFAMLAVLCGSAGAQKLSTEGLAFIDDDGDGMASPAPSSGETISRSGVKIKYSLANDKDQKPIAYTLSEPGVKALKPGDRVALFVKDVDYPRSALFDPTADKSILSVFPHATLDGAWKIVTIDSIIQVGDEVGVQVKETLKFKNGQTTNELRFVSKEGQLFDVRTPGMRPVQESAAVTSPVSTPPTPVSQTGGSSTLTWIVIGAIVLVVGASGIVLVMKRRSGASDIR